MAQFPQITKDQGGLGIDFGRSGSASSAGLTGSVGPYERVYSFLPPLHPEHSEKRQCPRRPLCCEMLLVGDVKEDPNEEPNAIPGQCLDIGEGGLYGVVPVGYGVAIGQRYTFRLTTGERGPEPGSLQVVSQRGRIIRTELLIEPDGNGDQIGIGVRLYGQRSGVVPMPTNVVAR